MRFIAKLGSLLVASAALSLTATPANAGILDDVFQVEVRSGSYYSGNRYYTPYPGSSDWAARRFIYNSRSPITRQILPNVAEYGEEGDWVADTLAIPGVTTFQNGRYKNYMTTVGRHDVNVNVRIMDRQRSARRTIVDMEIYLEMYGPQLNRGGQSVYVYVTAVQTSPGQWSFYPRDSVQGWRR